MLKKFLADSQQIGKDQGDHGVGIVGGDVIAEPHMAETGRETGRVSRGRAFAKEGGSEIHIGGERLLLDLSQLDMLEQVGTGACAVVYRAHYRPRPTNSKLQRSSNNSNASNNNNSNNNNKSNNNNSSVRSSNSSERSGLSVLWESLGIGKRKEEQEEVHVVAVKVLNKACTKKEHLRMFKHFFEREVSKWDPAETPPSRRSNNTKTK
jgi:hypothetical protein